MGGKIKIPRNRARDFYLSLILWNFARNTILLFFSFGNIFAIVDLFEIAHDLLGYRLSKIYGYGIPYHLVAINRILIQKNKIIRERLHPRAFSY